MACAPKFPNTSWLLNDWVLTLSENPAAADLVAMVVIDFELVLKGAAGAGVTVVDMLELCEEVDVSGGLDIAEVLDGEGFRVKIILLDAVLLLLLMRLVVPAIDTLETDDGVMSDAID